MKLFTTFLKMLLFAKMGKHNVPSHYWTEKCYKLSGTCFTMVDQHKTISSWVFTNGAFSFHTQSDNQTQEDLGKNYKSIKICQFFWAIFLKIWLHFWNFFKKTFDDVIGSFSSQNGENFPQKNDGFHPQKNSHNFLKF